MSKTWGKIGAWAADSEAAEAEELAAASAAASAEPSAAASGAFPSLREASATRQKKKTKMSLQKFNMSTSGAGLTPDEMLQLPTGPKERAPEEMVRGGRLGGGFSGYGGRDRDGEGSWSGGGARRSYGGEFEHEDRRTSGPPRGLEMDNLPSRADGADNWAVGKKNLPSFDAGRSSRYGALGSGAGGFGSRADDVDNWGAGKRAAAPAPVPGRSAFGSSFRDPGLGQSERPKLILDPPKKEVGAAASATTQVKTNKPSPFGAARPREEVLAEKGVDWKKMELDIEAKKTSRPTSSHSSRPTSSQSNRSEGFGVDGAVKPRPKVNPFGDAKPREVLLQEKGVDWRKIDSDLDHRRADRPKAEGERILKERDHLKKELAKQSASGAAKESHEGDTGNLHDTRDLQLLIHGLDDKVRFAPRVNERPGSEGGRISGPPSRSESFDDSRNMDFMGRPRSRGTGDIWSRQSDDRRAFRGGMERGYVGHRGMDRSREGW